MYIISRKISYKKAHFCDYYVLALLNLVYLSLLNQDMCKAFEFGKTVKMKLQSFNHKTD